MNLSYLLKNKTFKSKICKKAKRDPEINIIWSSVPPTNPKTTAENIISSRPDVKAEFLNATTQLSAWNVFFQ